MKLNLIEILEKQNKTMYWLAKETGLTYPSIHNLVSKTPVSVRLDTLEKICIALNCTPNDILILELL